MPRNPNRPRIIKSASFRKWKTARLKSKSAPKIKQKDAFRAFQIDRSLKAKERDPSYWKKTPQRADITIDKGTVTWKRKKKKYYRKER